MSFSVPLNGALTRNYCTQHSAFHHTDKNFREMGTDKEFSVTDQLIEIRTHILINSNASCAY